MVHSLISVIMPVYNGEAFIVETLESVIAQTHPHWELIVVDDGSTDATASIVAAFSEPRVRYTYQRNRGQAAALNHGLDLAQGDYITTLDADDVLPSNSLADRAAFLDEHHDFGAVYGDGYYCNASGEPQLRFSEYRPNRVIGNLYETLILTPFFGTGAAVMIRRQVLDESHLRYDESIVWCQDWDLYIRVAETTAFGAVDSSTIEYRLHQANMTLGMPSEQRLDSLIRTKLKVLESRRFAAVSTPRQSAFFLILLANDLQGRLDDQSAVLKHARFRALPSREQAKLLRQTSVSYLVRQEYPKAAREWLWAAWALAPLDLKTGLVASLTTLNLGLARRVVRAWQSSHQKGQVPSPLEVARHDEARRLQQQVV
jgi:glycosyltransferase involved in cell wall biosynthesis